MHCEKSIESATAFYYANGYLSIWFYFSEKYKYIYLSATANILPDINNIITI